MYRRIVSLFAILLSVAVALGGCSAPQGNTDQLQAASTEASEQLEKELGAFDITAQQRELAKTNEAGPQLD